MNCHLPQELLVSIRFCYLCRATLPEDDEAWVRPCRCVGPTTWIHQSCGRQMVQRFETLYPTKRPRCRFCRTRYIIVPKKGPIVRVMEKIILKLKSIVDIELIAAYPIIEAIATTCGCITLSYIYGYEEAKQLLMECNPVEAASTCALIGYGLWYISDITWEDWLLRALRRCSRVPFLKGVFPREYPDSLARSRKRMWSICSAIAGGALLPVYSRIIGTLMFSSVESPANQLLLGGTSFLAVKGILKMYYAQKTYVRQNSLSIENYR
ncbi:E3 ubiquitin-protein ligase march5 [Homalodisca vitripennis]|nr:E3 ubiquitin-protein ligase march5 [Homalodisca vitripennis]